MNASFVRCRASSVALTGAVLLALGALLSGCADMNDSFTAGFADPAAYDLYDCKQLENERKSLAGRMAELQGLIAKAQTGVAGPVVAELAYRNEYIATKGRARNAELAWAANKCRETAPKTAGAPTPPGPAIAVDKSGRQPMRSGSAVY